MTDRARARLIPPPPRLQPSQALPYAGILLALGRHQHAEWRGCRSSRYLPPGAPWWPNRFLTKLAQAPCCTLRGSRLSAITRELSRFIKEQGRADSQNRTPTTQCLPSSASTNIQAIASDGVKADFALVIGSAVRILEGYSTCEALFRNDLEIRHL
ncbi:uncharacterized protein VTP21DRAFT_2677 [Calcarisporiella thermophila]|uniref:uncharacterized protein n=1 Tax=Calcarisporiella thermophila TaxID=911321 RepID=UPI00374343AE